MEEYSSFLSWGWGSASSDSTGSRGRSAFQWGASVSALLLLILNQIGRKSGFQASLLVIFLVTSIPTLVFNILRLVLLTQLQCRITQDRQSSCVLQGAVWILGGLHCCYRKPVLSSCISSFSVPLLRHHTQLAG